MKILTILTLLHLHVVAARSSKRSCVFGDTPAFLSRRRRSQRDLPNSPTDCLDPVAVATLGDTLSSTKSKLPTTASNAVLCIRGGDIQTITSLSQIQTLLDDASQNNHLVVLDFTADNCPPCQMIAPIYTDLSNLEEFTNVTFCKVNVSHYPEVAAHYDVDGWPTFVLFKGGEVADTIVGGQAAKAGLYGLVAKYA
ncbi:hypothetical protein ACHAXR_001854 [Thalassiosira sp. AJA248-18]